VVVHDLQGSTAAEAARHLDKREAAVAGLLHRGLKRLQELLHQRE
jgi:DNA-directed RNA polymerase specialized sigma24 family protein